MRQYNVHWLYVIRKNSLSQQKVDIVKHNEHSRAAAIEIARIRPY